MSKNFTSVVKVVKPSDLKEERENGCATRASSSADGSGHLQVSNRTLTLPAIQPLPLSAARSAQLQAVKFNFDHVFGSDDAQEEIYRHSVKGIVESCLLGYHGTVISLGTEGEVGVSEKSGKGEGLLIRKAAKQISRCLKKSRRSKSGSSTANLVILCSSVIVTHEKIHDLLSGYTARAEQDAAEDELPPELRLVNGSMLRASQHKVKGGKVDPLIKFSRNMERKILDFYQTDEGASSPRGELQTTKRTHHTLFTLTVEYSQFGSMNAPVSGNLVFVDVAPTDPLAHRQRHTTGDEIEPGVVSLFTFADIVSSLTPNAAIIEDRMKSGDSGYNPLDSSQGMQLPFVPETMSKQLYKKSVLTQLLQDSLGGNCKTLLITYVPELVLPYRYGETYETLKMASRARLIQNTPNKRDLAEKALMSAYMRGLQEMYGQGVLAKQEEEKRPRRTRITLSSVAPFHDESGSGSKTKRMLSSTSKDSISSDDIDTAYDEMINITEGEKRQQNMEMAATALVAAALKDKEEEEGKGQSSDISGSDDDSSDDDQSKSTTPEDATPLPTKVRLKKKKKKVDPRKAALMGGGALESASVSSITERDITIDILINIIQDPDKGVPRPPVSALKDVQIRKDAGSVFSGADLVHWMVQNIDGVEDEDDAETLGQLLLDNGALIHSEGSKVFANAETLFYYTSFSRPTKKLLSLEEVKRLLAQATGQPPPHNVTEVSNIITDGQREEEGSRVQSNDDGTAITEVDDEEIETERNEQSGLNDRPPPAETARVEHQGESFTNGRENMPQGRESFVDGEGVVQPIIEAFADGQETTTHDVQTGGIADSAEAKHNQRAHHLHEEDGDGNYEEYTQLDEEVEQARADLLKRLEEASDEPNTVAQEHIPSIQTLEKTTDYPHPLHMAVAIGKSSGVVRQLVMMFGVNKRDEYKRTPLMFAALGNNKSSSCSTLIDCGAEIDRQDICGLTALHVACYHGNKAAVSVLLNKGASVCKFDNTDHSAYHWSSVPHDHSCLQLLMSVATPELVMYADRCGLTALHWAISYDHPQHLKLLLKMCKDPLHHDSEGRTLMTYAIQQQAMQCAKVLLSSHPSLLTHGDAKGAAPLHHASIHKVTHFLELILSYKLPKKSPVSLDINCKNHSGRTPLHCAVAYNVLQNVTLLATRGAQVEAVDNEGKTPVDYVNNLGDGDRELMLAALQAGRGSSDEANPSSKTQSSKVCTTL